MASTAYSYREEYSRKSRPKFGHASVARTYTTKLRWLVGTLLLMIGLLICALFILQDSAPQIVETSTPAQTFSLNRVNILVARKRIEVGERLRDELFQEQEISSQIIPDGAVLASELSNIRGYFATELINTGFPISRHSISEQTQEETIIPAGYRAISISIDEVTSVSYQVKANNRVDVLLSFSHKGKPAVIPVVQSAKVLTVGIGNTATGESIGAKTATLLVTLDDAMKIELAKQHGKLGLVRAGELEILPTASPAKPVTLIDIFQSEEQSVPLAERIDGKLFTTDPKTGRQAVYVLTHGKWKME